MNKNERKCWVDSFSVVFRKCPYCGSSWSREFIESIFVNFCPRCGKRVFKEDDLNDVEENNESIRTC